MKDSEPKKEKQVKDLRSTKPTHVENVVPTNKGWVDAETGELLVAITNLQNRLEVPVNPIKRTRGRPRKTE
jgi:hypothetical protein